MDKLFYIDSAFVVAGLIIFFFVNNSNIIGIYAFLLLFYYAATPKESYIIKLLNKVRDV